MDSATEDRSIVAKIDPKLVKAFVKAWHGDHYWSWSGVTNSTLGARNELKLPLSQDEVRAILFLKIPTFVLSLRKPIVKETRHFDAVSSFFVLTQCDLAEMRVFNGFHYFLILIDIYSRMLWLEPLKHKTSKEVAAAFLKIFKRAGAKPDEVRKHFSSLAITRLLMGKYFAHK